jgi:hypothetical protein
MNLGLDTRLLEELSDEAAFVLCELLHELTQAFESRYYHQIQRYQSAKQADLFDPDQPWIRRQPASD